MLKIKLLLVALFLSIFSNMSYARPHFPHHTNSFSGDGYTPHNYSSDSNTPAYRPNSDSPEPVAKKSRQEKMNEELARVKQSYDELILRGKPDPYPELMADSSKRIVAGPEGSNLLALVKIENSGKGRYYSKEANSQLAKNPEVQEAIRRNLDSGDELIVDSSGKRNPNVQKSDGSIVKLEWHHSPNHIGSVSLIEKGAHRLAGNKAKLHYEGQKGGNEMFNTQY
jgi:hypothetical protein